MGNVGAMMGVSPSSALIISFALGYGLPSDEKDTSSNYWKYMLMYYFVIAAINFLVFLFFFRLDTPSFYNKK